MKKILMFLCAGCIALCSFGQSSVVPSGYKLEKPADYAAYEKDVLRCIDWLMKAPVNDPGRKEANTFLISWISGSPDVSIGISGDIVNFTDHPDLLMIFMAGWTRYALETRKFDDAYNGNLKGLESVIAYYLKNKSVLKEDSHVEEYIRMQQNNTLGDYVKKHMTP